MKKYLILSLLLISSLNIFASKVNALKSTIRFYKSLKLSNNYELRTLKNLEESEKVQLSIKGKAYNAYSFLLKEDDNYSFKTKFYAGYDYILVASGDRVVKDLDVIIYDGNGDTVSIDRKPTKQAFPRLNKDFLSEKSNANKKIEKSKISIRPLKTDFYTIKVKNRKTSNINGGYCSLMIASKKAN